MLRGRKHNVEITDEVVTVEPEDTHSSDFLLRQALHKAISQLPDEFREALSMKYFDDLPYEDIAAALDITVALAKVRVFRAKKLIQQTMSTIIDELR
jgi:RNA polymerase sigma-70 factor (ECF subfamily)